MIYVIGIGHRAQQGKSSLAILLQAILQSKGALTHKLSFADSLKSIYRIESGNFKTKDANALQKLAEEVKAKHGEDIFAKDLVARINDHYRGVQAVSDIEPQVVYLVDDLRHTVELEALKSFENNLLIRLTRTVPVAVDRDMDHRSENELSIQDWEDLQVNAADMEELRLAAMQVYNAIFGDDYEVDQEEVSSKSTEIN